MKELPVVQKEEEARPSNVDIMAQTLAGRCETALPETSFDYARPTDDGGSYCWLSRQYDFECRYLSPEQTEVSFNDGMSGMYNRCEK